MAFESIEDFKDLHKGKNCFIISSGTSLSDLDLSPLERRITIGLNRSFMAFPSTTYNCVMDHRLFDLYPEEIKNTRYLFTLEDRPWGIPLKLQGSDGFSFDLQEGIFSGYTISYFALQLAIYMGFKRIFFLGLDLKTNKLKRKQLTAINIPEMANKFIDMIITQYKPLTRFGRKNIM